MGRIIGQEDWEGQSWLRSSKFIFHTCRSEICCCGGLMRNSLKIMCSNSAWKLWEQSWWSMLLTFHMFLYVFTHGRYSHDMVEKSCTLGTTIYIDKNIISFWADLVNFFNGCLVRFFHPLLVYLETICDTFILWSIMHVHAMLWDW